MTACTPPDVSLTPPGPDAAFPPGVDFFTVAADVSQVGVYRAECVSKTCSKTAGAGGRRNRYALAFRWEAIVPGRLRFRVLSCGCEGWGRASACRHAVQLTDIVNVPAVAGCLLACDACEVREAYQERPCGKCGGDVYAVRLAFQSARPALALRVCAGCEMTVVLR